MGADMFDKIEGILSLHLQNRRSLYQHKSLKDVTANFLCLAVEARPGFLYDQGRIDGTAALKIARELAKCMRSFQDLVVVEYEQDIIFVRLETMLAYLDDMKMTFIDVEEKGPVIFDGTNYATRLCGIFGDFKRDIPDLQVRTVNLDDQNIIEGPCMIGLLLGFPVVYYLQKDIHCLNNLPLLITKCTILLSNSKITVCSFTTPSECVNKDVELTLNNWIRQFKMCLLRTNLLCKITQSVESFPSLIL